MYEFAKNGIWSKKIHEIELFDFMIFLDWTFLNFLAHCGEARCLKAEDVRIFEITTRDVII